MTVRDLLESILCASDHEDDILVTFNGEVIEPRIRRLPPIPTHVQVSRSHIDIELPHLRRPMSED